MPKTYLLCELHSLKELNNKLSNINTITSDSIKTILNQIVMKSAEMNGIEHQDSDFHLINVLYKLCEQHINYYELTSIIKIETEKNLFTLSIKIDNNWVRIISIILIIKYGW